MEPKQLTLLQKTLDDIRHQNGVEHWFARELFSLLGYSKWEHFEYVINKAKQACRNSGGRVEDHFLDVRKMVETGSGAERAIQDFKLTRYACYLIAINGDPRKPEIAFAQVYFVTQTRNLEVLQQRMSEIERLDAREQLKLTEKEFSSLLINSDVDRYGIAIIRSDGDKELFGGKDTEEVKREFGIAKTKPIADFLPSVTLKAKDLATTMTTENTRGKGLRGLQPIKNEHKNNNRNVRDALVKSDIYPELLPPSEDIKKINSRHRKEIRELESRQKKELEVAKGKMAKKKDIKP